MKFAPFLSLFSLIAVAFAVVFLKMQTIELSYEMVKLRHLHKTAQDDKARLEMRYARLTRPERIDRLATKNLSLARAQKKQVVLMAAAGNIAVRQ